MMPYLMPEIHLPNQSLVSSRQIFDHVVAGGRRFVDCITILHSNPNRIVWLQDWDVINWIEWQVWSLLSCTHLVSNRLVFYGGFIFYTVLYILKKISNIYTYIFSPSLLFMFVSFFPCSQRWPVPKKTCLQKVVVFFGGFLKKSRQHDSWCFPWRAWMQYLESSVSYMEGWVFHRENGGTLGMVYTLYSGYL